MYPDRAGIYKHRSVKYRSSKSDKMIFSIKYQPFYIMLDLNNAFDLETKIGDEDLRLELW